jgi:hypothetical protein
VRATIKPPPQRRFDPALDKRARKLGGIKMEKRFQYRYDWGNGKQTCSEFVEFKRVA